MNIVLQYSRIFSFLKVNFDRVSIVFGLVDTIFLSSFGLCDDSLRLDLICYCA